MLPPAARRQLPAPSAAVTAALSPLHPQPAAAASTAACPKPGCPKPATPLPLPGVRDHPVLAVHVHHQQGSQLSHTAVHSWILLQAHVLQAVLSVNLLRGHAAAAGRDHRRGSSVGGGGGGGGRRRGFVGRSLDRVFGRRRVAPHDDDVLVRTADCVISNALSNNHTGT